jgi:hypothetical protein
MSPARTRDYAAEYAARNARARAQGTTYGRQRRLRQQQAPTVAPPAVTFGAPIDLLAEAHRIDTGGTYTPTGDSPPHMLELAVATRMAVEGAARRRTVGNLWGFPPARRGQVTPRRRQADRVATAAATRRMAQGMGVSPATVRTWRHKGIPASRRADVETLAVRLFVTTPPGPRDLSALRDRGANGATVTFTGDYSILVTTSPPQRAIRTRRTITAGYIAPSDLREFVAYARGGMWEDSAIALEGAFWPAYFAEEGNADDLEPEWVHAESIEVAP